MAVASIVVCKCVGQPGARGVTLTRSENWENVEKEREYGVALSTVVLLGD